MPTILGSIMIHLFSLDYNPLMGNSGGSSRYRPDRRSGYGGGGGWG